MLLSAQTCYEKLNEFYCHETWSRIKAENNLKPSKLMILACQAWQTGREAEVIMLLAELRCIWGNVIVDPINRIYYDFDNSDNGSVEPCKID